MKHPLIKFSLQVIIMLSIISKAFGLSKAPEEVPFMPRQINLSGNIVHFAMPENFSRDMPAEDMIESVNLKDKSIYQDYEKFTLIRRWWDFKESGIFGKTLGTLMMSLYIKEASGSLSINTLKPLDFIDIIIDDINKNKPGEEDLLMMYSDYFTAYKEHWFNEQRWLEYLQGHSNSNQLAILYAIPITERQYLVAEFISAPNNNVHIRSFIDKHTDSFITKIMNSFRIEYTPDNQVKQAVLKANAKIELQKLIDDKVLMLEKQQ